MAKIVKIKRYGRPNRAAVIPLNPPRGTWARASYQWPLKTQRLQKAGFKGRSIGELWRKPSRSQWPSLSGYRFLNRANSVSGRFFAYDAISWWVTRLQH